MPSMSVVILPSRHPMTRRKPTATTAAAKLIQKLQRTEELQTERTQATVQSEPDETET
jgi:hypothetical protein